jgi:hypothetical protein
MVVGQSGLDEEWIVARMIVRYKCRVTGYPEHFEKHADYSNTTSVHQSM